MDTHKIRELINDGENSGTEFKRDDIRPEQLAEEIVALINFKGGTILLGVEDDGTVSGTTRNALEEQVMNICTQNVHPRIIPYYEEIRIDEKRIAAITLDMGIAKPYVVRSNQREDVYIRVGSTSRLASREEQMRLFQEGGFLHVETLPVAGTRFSDLDQRRLTDYFRRIRKPDDLPSDNKEWIHLLTNMEYMSASDKGAGVCTIAGLVLFGRRPGKALYQAGLEWVVFPGKEKDYDKGLRIPRNPILIQTLKDYGYVEYMGMGVRNKIIAGMKKHNGTEPVFIADDFQVAVGLLK